MLNSEAQFSADLTACDREPITRLDRIQSFGFMLALTNDWTIARVSANTAEMFGISPEALIGKRLESVISRTALHNIRNQITMLRAGTSERLYNIALVDADARFDLNLHFAGEMLVVEGEPTSGDNRTEAATMVRTMIARLSGIDAMPEFHRDAARQVRAITGFDRVMIYRFEGSGDGDVIAESTRSNFGSFLGLRFPASDIPVQARALYLQNPFRIIADVTSETVPLVPPRGGPAEALDMAQVVTRAVSPAHIEYLANMGVGASLSISIIVEGKLWGLIACHHNTPRRPSFVMRTAAELFGHMYSMTLESRIHARAAKEEQRGRALADRLIAAIAVDETLLGNAEWLRDVLSPVIDCDGVAVVQRGQITRNGGTPDVREISALARYLDASSPSRVFDTDNLAHIQPACAATAEVAAGMLAIPISRTPRDYIMLFRRELLEEVRWSGDPHKALMPTDDGLRLSPRKSFEAYVKMVRGKCVPFSDYERRIAEATRVAVIEVILRYSEAASEEQRRSFEKSELLIAELNHRVRNILTLIRGLVARTTEGSEGIAQYVSSLNGRIQALARAHDYVTQHSWGPASIEALLKDEVNAHRHGDRDPLILDGPRVLLQPTAIATMALVIHELVTNSAKYGALSTTGEIHVALEPADDGALVVRWRERDGPAVTPPTRRGFGSVVVERTIPFDLQGTADVRYLVSGLEADFTVPAKYVILPGARLSLPLDHRAPLAATPGPSAPPEADGAPLDGATVLLLEDNLIIALETEDMLCALGAREVVAASTIDHAAALIKESRFDFAVLDINVGGQTSFAFARMLVEAGIPYIFASGYGDQVPMESNLANPVVLQKPYDVDCLRRAVHINADSDAPRNEPA